MHLRFLFALPLVLVACGNQTLVEGPSDPALDSVEDLAFFELNSVRESAGLTTPLVLCTALNVAAARHSDDMRANTYLSDTAPDGSGVRERACSAGYQTSCSEAASLAELVASGIDDGKEVVDQWAANLTDKAAITDPKLIAGGVARSIADDMTTYWTVVLGSIDDASCK